METLIEKGDPRFDNLVALWLEERKPGYVCPSGGGTYRVIVVSDEEVKFQPLSLQDNMYSSTSLKGR